MSNIKSLITHYKFTSSDDIHTLNIRGKHDKMVGVIMKRSKTHEKVYSKEYLLFTVTFVDRDYTVDCQGEIFRESYDRVCMVFA